MLPTHIVEALTGVPGDVEAVRQWLTSRNHHQETLNRVVWFAATHARNFATEAKIDIVLLALARGAEPHRMFAIQTTAGETAHSADALSVVSSQAAQSSPRLIDLLLRQILPGKEHMFVKSHSAFAFLRFSPGSRRLKPLQLLLTRKRGEERSMTRRSRAETREAEAFSLHAAVP